MVAGRMWPDVSRKGKDSMQERVVGWKPPKAEKPRWRGGAREASISTWGGVVRYGGGPYLTGPAVTLFC